MLAPAARVSDFHTCPVLEPVATGNGTATMVPHIGGPILQPGSADVLIAGEHAAMVGVNCSCGALGNLPISQPIDTITSGSSSVMINGKPAARKGDRTLHAGVITTGAATVFIGG
jgi:uncharacterized Zn-binding protein involved in type VI secretion